MTRRKLKSTDIVFASAATAGDIERADQALAGAQLFSIPRQLALEVELARQIDFPFREMPGSKERLLAYALEFCPGPGIARLSIGEFSADQFVRLEVFRRIAGKWLDVGHSVLELSAARSIAEAIVRIPAVVPLSPEVVQ